MASEQTDGGRAFPTQSYEEDGSDKPGLPSVLHHGMSLRDYFAAKAMQGMLSNVTNSDGYREVIWGEERARLAYQQADAMLAARCAPKGGA